MSQIRNRLFVLWAKRCIRRVINAIDIAWWGL